MIKLATETDWPQLFDFYKRIYRANHPLQNVDFWKWQYGNQNYGAAYIVVWEDKIAGHLGASFSNGLAWVMNLYIDPFLRGTRSVLKLYDAVRDHGLPLVTTGANEFALNMYRKLNWIRYSNLERLIAVNPVFRDKTRETLLTPVVLNNLFEQPADNYYWLQPGIRGIRLNDGSTGIVQPKNGGVRLVEIVNPGKAIEEIWQLDFKWCDYITSWNDKIIDNLLRREWKTENEFPFAWYFAPVDPGSASNITFLSEEPIDKKIIVKRYHSDHGRVASL